MEEGEELKGVKEQTGRSLSENRPELKVWEEK